MFVIDLGLLLPDQFPLKNLDASMFEPCLTPAVLRTDTSPPTCSTDVADADSDAGCSSDEDADVAADVDGSSGVVLVLLLLMQMLMMLLKLCGC